MITNAKNISMSCTYIVKAAEQIFEINVKVQEAKMNIINEKKRLDKIKFKAQPKDYNK